MKKNENTLLDLVAEKIGARSDKALAISLDYAPPVISRVRQGHLPVGAGMVLRIHLLTDMPIREIKSFVTRGRQAPKRFAGAHRALGLPYGVAK